MQLQTHRSGSALHGVSGRLGPILCLPFLHSPFHTSHLHSFQLPTNISCLIYALMVTQQGPSPHWLVSQCAMTLAYQVDSIMDI